MSQYVGLYISYCDLCLCTKIQHHLPSGELRPLLIPEECWDVISVDFISELPESGGYDSIMVAINSVGKHSHFVETVTTVTTAGAANLYLRNIWKLHGLPRKVVSNRRPQFVAALVKELYWLLGIEAAMSTAYLPQTNRQTEQVNQKLEQYLWTFVTERQDDWYTTPSPGGVLLQQPQPLIHTANTLPPWYRLTPRMGFKLHQPPSRFEAVNKFTDQMKDTLEEAKSALAKAKDNMVWYYNCCRSPAPSFSPGNMVYLDSEDIQTTCWSKKLLHRRLGPYPVERRVGKYAYHLVLPPHETPSPSF